MNRLPGHSSSNPNEGIEGIESLLDRQLYFPLRENLVWPGPILWFSPVIEILYPCVELDLRTSCRLGPKLFLM